MIDMQITDLGLLLRQFDHLEKVTKRKILSKALREGFKPTLKMARSLAPVKTGLMKKKIRLFKTKNRQKDTVRFRVRTGSREEMGIPKEAEHYYPAVVEYTHFPFMRLAFQYTKKEVVETVTKGIREQVQATLAALGWKPRGGPFGS